MEKSVKKDVLISFGIGLAIGLLATLIVSNLISVGFLTRILIMLGFGLVTPLGYLAAFWLSRWFPVMMQVVKFGIVGGLNTMVDLGVLNLLIGFFEKPHGIYYSIFKSLSFLTAVTSSYFWNKYWTFRAGNGPQAVEFLEFFIVNLVGFGVNVGMASLIVNFVGAPAGVDLKLWANIGALSAVVVSMVWNFTGMKFIVFKK